jgi:flavodoxin short chain
VVFLEWKDKRMAKAVIIYESRTGNTEMMAKAIEQGLRQAGVDVVALRSVKASASNLQDVDAVILGSPTYHKDMVASMKTFLFEMEKVNLKKKVGAAFGSYGWSGESVDMLTQTMKHIFEMDVIEPGLRILRRPEEDGLRQCQQFGEQIAARIKRR